MSRTTVVVDGNAYAVPERILKDATEYVYRMRCAMNGGEVAQPNGATMEDRWLAIAALKGSGLLYEYQCEMPTWGFLNKQGDD